MPLAAPRRPRSTLLTILALWAIFYASFTLFTPPLLDDADSVHAEVAREMLLRHDYITLYANGIRYLEKAPLLYWSMALSMRIAQLFGHSGPRALAAAARIPLALTILALALTTEAFARRAFRSTRAGLYAALILLSSPGIFLFTHILLPDAMVCLWLTLALYAFYLTEQPPNWVPHLRDSPIVAKVGIEQSSTALSRDATKDGVLHPSQHHPDRWDVRLLCYAFAACCALNVLTKGLIGIVFPRRDRPHLPTHHARPRAKPSPESASSTLSHPCCLPRNSRALAHPHCPSQPHPGPSRQPHLLHGHLAVPLPTDGNVHGWLWFYFVNEQLLRYLNLRVPRDYDTVPLWLFWGLCLIWLMPWSAFVFKAVVSPIRTSFNAYMRTRSTGLPSSPILRYPANFPDPVGGINLALLYSLHPPGVLRPPGPSAARNSHRGLACKPTYWLAEPSRAKRQSRSAKRLTAVSTLRLPRYPLHPR